MAGGPLAFEEYEAPLFEALQEWDCPDTLIERAQSAQGDSGVFEYGRTFGRTEAAVVLAGCSIWYCAPAWWKGKLGCPVDKKRAYALAFETFPELPFFANNGPRGGLDTGTAEAALIGSVMAKPHLRAQVEKNNAARVKPKRRRVRYEL